MATVSGRESDVGDAFRRLLHGLNGLADVVDREAGDAIERAEGYRHLSRLFSACEEWFLQKSDPDRPAFTRVMTPWRKFIGDNPDTLYDVAPVAPGTTYRFTGRRNGALYLGLTVYGRDSNGNITMLAQLADGDFVGPDGSFNLVVGGDDPGSDAAWMPVPERAESLWVRQYFHDVESEQPATYTFEPAGRAAPPPPLAGQQVAAAFDRMSSYMTDTLDAVVTVSRMMAKSPNSPIMAGAAFEVEGGGDDDGPANELETLLLQLARTSYPTPDNRYAGVWFELESDQALVITGKPPRDARYWGLQLANRWQESLDFVGHQVCLNDQQIELETDGSYRVVVAATDPGTGNWLDSAGHRCGMVNVRALLSSELEDPIFDVVPLDSLRGSTLGN